jgi:hypothetical protein
VVSNQGTAFDPDVIQGAPDGQSGGGAKGWKEMRRFALAMLAAYLGLGDVPVWLGGLT